MFIKREGSVLIVLIVTLSIVLLVLLYLTTKQPENISAKIEIKEGLIYQKGADIPFTGEILDTLENKIIKYDVLEGMKTGEFCLLSIKGEYAVHGFLKNNKNVGPWKYYYSNGRLESQGNFKDDQPHGEWIWYFENGNIRTIGLYVDGKSEGTWRTFDESGRVTSVTKYKNGEVQSEVVVTKMSFS
jgi:antitoxin component YwqK of YwqJK toxin-antitoxin module